MSGIASLFNVPTTPEELSSWATSHASHHRDISRRIYEISNGVIVLPEYLLDPIDPNNTGVWEAQHQIMHQDMDAVLNINGFDLSTVDFNNTEALTGWVQLNGNEHFIAAAALGIG